MHDKPSTIICTSLHHLQRKKIKENKKKRNELEHVIHARYKGINGRKITSSGSTLCDAGHD